MHSNDRNILVVCGWECWCVWCDCVFMQMLLSGVQSTAGLAVVSVLGSVSFGLICCSGGYCTWALRLSLCACRLQQFFPGATSASETCSFRKTMGTPRSSIRLSPVLECVQRHMPAPSSHGPSLTGYCSNHHVPLAGLVLADVEVRARLPCKIRAMKE